MSNEVTIAGVQSARITYKDRPVCTTQQLAQFYSCTEKNISDNYANNRDRFEEGKHFVKLEGAALQAFKNCPENFGSVASRAASLILWTELGSARHAKMLTTDKAWDVYEEMEETYFQHKSALMLEKPARPARARGAITRSQVAAGILLLRSAAEDLKLAPSAVLGSYQKLEAQIGIPGLLPAYAVDAPSTAATGSSEVTKSADELLKLHGVSMSTIAFNKLLVKRGFLEERERPSTKGSGIKKFKVCTNMAFGKNFSDPKNPRATQPHWFVSKFAELLTLVLPPKEPPTQGALL